MVGGGEHIMRQSKVADAWAAADEAFGADMYRLLAEDAADMVFSPESVASVLRMALLGARGKTAGELAGALRLDGSPDAAADALSSVSSVLGEVTADESVTFRAPSTVWVQSGLPLRPEFTARLRDIAEATLTDADFAGDPEAARAEINRVIAEQTAGKITGLLPSGAISVMTRLVLASAVYLKAQWALPFPESATGDEPFYPDGRERPGMAVPMMRGTAARDYLRGDGYQAVLLPYANARLAMAVVLPDGPLAGLSGRLAGSGLRGLLAGPARHQVTLSMPKFRQEAKFSLIPVLQQLGVHEAFSGSADFTGITDAGSLSISTIAHKAYIDVDEHGTEAAAATAAVIRAAAALRTPPPVTMVVDRPFLFAIIETSAGLPLFLGQVTHPRSP
jgi:serpin B